MDSIELTEVLPRPNVPLGFKSVSCSHDVRCIGIGPRLGPRLKERWCWNPNDRAPEWDKLLPEMAEAYRNVETDQALDATVQLPDAHAKGEGIRLVLPSASG